MTVCRTMRFRPTSPIATSPAQGGARSTQTHSRKKPHAAIASRTAAVVESVWWTSRPASEALAPSA